MDVRQDVAPVGARVRADAHRLDKADGTAHRAEVLRDVAGGDVGAGPGGLAHRADASAIRLEAGHGRIVKHRVTELLVHVGRARVSAFRGEAAPHRIGFQVAIAPVLRDAAHGVGEEFTGARMRHVKAPAGPEHFVKRTILLLHEPILVLLKQRIARVPRERREPQTGADAVGGELLRVRLHARRVRAFRIVPGEVARRTAADDAALRDGRASPLVVHQNGVKTKLRKSPATEGRQFGHRLFARRPAVRPGIPGAIAVRDLRQLGLVHPRDGVRVSLQAEPRVRE